MTADFAELIMPILRKVIDLQDRLAWGESRGLDEVKQSTGSWIEEGRRRAMGKAGIARSFSLSQRGLIALIDEVLTDSEWGRKVNWGSEQNVLEWDYYQSNDRAWLFYKHADVAESDGDLDALEVYLLCVTLGFRGELIHDDSRLADWVHRVYEKVTSAGGIPSRPFAEDVKRKDQFGPLSSPALLLRVSILVSITAILTLAAYIFAVHMDFNAGS